MGATHAASATWCLPVPQQFTSVRSEMERRGNTLAIPHGIELSIFLFSVKSDQKTEETSRKAGTLSFSLSFASRNTYNNEKNHTAKSNPCK